jgi:hypothetical protein
MQAAVVVQADTEVLLPANLQAAVVQRRAQPRFRLEAMLSWLAPAALQSQAMLWGIMGRIHLLLALLLKAVVVVPNTQEAGILAVQGAAV